MVGSSPGAGHTQRVATGVLAAAGVAAWALACAAPIPASSGRVLADDRAEAAFDQLWSSYERQLPPKAFAFAYDGDDWVWGIVEGARDRSQAETEALVSCEGYRSRKGVRAPCALYAVDGEVVWSLRDYLREFQSYPLHKAFWVAGEPENPLFDAVMKASSPDQAASLAMQDCRTQTEVFGLAHTCRICQLDDGVDCTRLESGWSDP